MTHKKKFLVTGANGFLGKHVCRQLAEKGYDVVAIDLPDNDITDSAAMVKLFQEHKPDGVFHTAALLPHAKGGDDVQSLFKANVIGTLNILEACRQAGVKNIIYSSSMSVYGTDIATIPVTETHALNPATPYAVSKKHGEDLCQLYHKLYGFNVIVLRYSGIYGKGPNNGIVSKFITQARNGEPLQVNSKSSWDIVLVDDVATANIAAMERAEELGFETINIGSGQEITVKELAEKIIDLSKSSSRIECPDNFPPAAPRFYFDIVKAKKMLGFAPTPVAEGLTKAIQP